ncbi:MAG: ribulose-phosphate 3-epimerase [Caldiserica bacterium]|nr:MAG: ribulose-phosphate 3-epimerase [Caldisericota bacterium]
MKIAPSILASSFVNLKKDIELLERSGADIVHLDIMDGHFVPNISFGFPIVKAVRDLTSLPLDAHLMIENPEKFIDRFIDSGVDMISVHIEGNYHINRILNTIKKNGVKAGIAINPGTPLSFLEEVLSIVDFVLVMSVNPGFSGQKFIDSSIEKIRKLCKIRKKENFSFEIEVDGGLNFEIAKVLKEMGIDILVFGSFIFKDIEKALEELRKIK